MSVWQRGCSVGNTSSDGRNAARSTNSRNFERDRDLPQSTASSSSSGWGGGRDSRPCHAFQRGQCRDGNACRYQHQQQQHIPTPTATATTTVSKSISSSQPSPAAPNCSETTSEGEVSTQAINLPEAMKCPPRLFRSRDYLFKGIELAQRRNIVMDTVASFSVTESHMADKMTEKILQFAEKVKPHDNVIFDGMACVGGNTISFAQSFKTVLANEFDESRFEMLRHNVRDVLGINNVTFLHGSILDLGVTEAYDILFLDPEWGGPDYKFKKQLLLTVSGESVEALCARVMRLCPRVHTIALKLPVNYYNECLQRAAEAEGLTYSLFTNFQKMTLTILQRRI